MTQDGEMFYSDKDFLIYIDFDKAQMQRESVMDDLHMRDMYLFGVCVEGSCDVMTGDRRSTVMPRHMMIILPATYVTIDNVSDDFKVCMLGISTDFYHDFLQDVFPSPVSIKAFVSAGSMFPLDTASYGRLMGFFRFMGECLSAPRTDVTHVMLRHLLTAMAFWVYDRIPTQHGEGKTHGENIVETLLSNISKHYKEKRKVAYYAGLQCLTPKYLSAVSKEVSGRNVSRWVSEFVVADAKRQLRLHNRSVQQVACALRFPDQSAFAKYFRKHTGMSPKEYKRQVSRLNR